MELLSHKKEHIWVSSDEVDEPRTYYIEWSESEREKELKNLLMRLKEESEKGGLKHKNLHYHM